MKMIRKNIWLFLLLISGRGLCQTDSAGGYGYFSGGNILVVPSSHQDIAWMDTPEKCAEFRDVYMITPALKRLKESKDFRFSVENALNLYEYLAKHPDRLGEIIKYTKEGRLEWGATYNQPYEGLYAGEALIREAYYGKKKLQKIIPGAEFVCAWSEDVPGRTLQGPQIFAKAGIKYLQFSRFQPGIYNWYSPDGSYITCWTPGQYEASGRTVRNAATDEQRTRAFTEKLIHWNDYYKKRNLSPALIYIHSHDFSEPLNYDQYFDQWNNRVRQGISHLPSIHYATGTEALAAASGKGKIDSIQGERPNVWLYIHGPTHEKAIKAGRSASRLLTAAEKFSVIRSALKGNFNDYPQQEFDKAWQEAIYPDHGWGGVHGDITDRIFRNSYERAAATADSILGVKTKGIAAEIKQEGTGIPVVVFNPLSWQRTDPVEFTVNTEGIYADQFQLTDAKGNIIDHQVIASPSKNSDAQLRFVFIAADIPSVGYKTFYLVPGKNAAPKNLKINITGNVIDTRFYKIVLAKGGVRSIYDKDLQQELVNPGKFLCGEMFSMQSVGNGAGEFTDVQQPDMTGFEKMSQYAPDWVLLENGPVRTVFETAHPWRNCTVKQRLILYTTLKRIDFEADIIGFNGEKSREFRLAFPLRQDSSSIAYEVPMGVVEVGKSELPMAAGFSKPEQIYSTPCREVHPREVQDWFSASDKNASVTISSDVAVFDWMDPTSQPVGYPILQPLLLASRRSCNESPLANWYLQRGDHHYSFSFFSHAGSWKQGWKNGKQVNAPLIAVVNGKQAKDASLPESDSFAAVDQPNVVISAIKKCDDDNQVVFRCYDVEGLSREVKINWFKGVRSFARTNIIEEEPVPVPLLKGEMKTTIGPYAIETYKIIPGK
jgi:alpha-mannosidase